MKGRKGYAGEEIPLQIMQDRCITPTKGTHVKQCVMLTCSVRGIVSMRMVDMIVAGLTHQGML